ncbi:Dyp-type peroxidase [Saccharothrix sp. 6-C]|uniref:Dyp-type peroxidase n=1 Tax=Saccharothrix sp. 6-C TaxID=2781735 RepID=UPI0019173291|nr:Dyp-type peroxidase [Saccharothrix sp. 6-C]QQQ74635.1 Dyp-type peroxidase [Saccharothrix sp. 6-C]
MTDLLHHRAPRREVPPPLRRSHDIQGNVLAAFNKDHQLFRFVRFTDDRLGRTWLAAMLGHLDATSDVEDFNELFSFGRTTSGGDPAGLRATWANVSLTPECLIDLSVNPDATREDLREHFPHTAERAARANGDTGDSAPAHWLFGRADQRVDAVVTVASDDPDRLAGTARDLDVLDTLLGVTTVHEQHAATLPGDRRGREHFGYKDGISQPGVRGFHHEDRDRPGHRAGRPGTLLVNAGEFVFGHPAESPRPHAAAWLTDGSIQVVRRLTQDVDGWRDAVERHGRGPELIGRRPDGRPLAARPGHPDGGHPEDPVRHNDFDYADDPAGTATPCPAHIRKTNPRSFTHRTPREHRVLRRGIPFGPAATGSADDHERGLVFVAHCTSLAEQFEYVQRTWALNPDFAPGERGAPTGVDAVIGGGFVRTTGALYALTPSISTLRLLAAGRELPR